MNNRALPPLKVPSGKFPGKYKSAEQFSTNEDARLRCALDEEGVEEEGDLSVLEKCPDEPREIIQHLSGVLRSEPRISKAPLAWFLVHRKLADAFLTSHDMQSMKSAIFHLQQALRGLKRLKSMQSEIPRAEIDIARCFGEIADSLPPPQRRRRRREAIEREMQAADSAMIHAKEASSKDVEMIRDACEEKAASCIRRFNYSRDRSLSAAVLEDAILSLTEATESASSSSPRHQESLGRLAECFLARAADVEDNHKYCVEALQNAHKTMRVMQKTIEDKESLIYAKLQVSIANVLALQLLRGESWPPSNREDGTIEKVLKLVGQATESFDKDDRRDDGYLVSLRCLEAQMRMLKDSREEAMRALRHAAEICESNKNIDMIPNAIRYEIFRGIAFLSDDPLDSLERFRPSSSNPDAVCVYELELARAYYNAGRLDDARAAVFRALPPAFDVLRRYPLETDTLGRTTLDAAISVIGAIVDLGVDIVASVIQRDHADKLKTSGAWLWLSHERGISRKPDEEMPDSNRWQMAQAAFDLLLLMEALAGLPEIQSLGPILTRQFKEQEFLSDSLIESGVAAREACARVCDTANNDSYLFRPPILATQPVPVVSTRSAESTAMQGTLVDQLKPVPIILRTPTTRLKPAQDRSEATAAATKFARLLEECPDYLLSCIGCAFRTKTHEDFLTVADECLLTWAVCGQGQKKSLVGVALYSGQAGIFFTNWDEDCSREFEALASSVRFERGHPSQHCAAKLSHLLKLDALVAGLPDQVEHMVVVLPTALSNVPVHALPIHKSESGETVFLCDRLVIRYATSGAAAAAVNRRCTKRRDSTPLNPLLAFTKAKDKTGRNLETLLCDAIGASWEGPQVQILDADQLLRAIEWSQTQEEKVVDVRNDLKYARGVHMGTVSQGLDTAGGVPSLASGERTVIASKVAPNLFERADMIVLSNGHMPRLDQTPSTSIPTAMLCAGSNAVVTSLWDIPSRGGQKPGLVRAILTAVLWKKFNGMRIR